MVKKTDDEITADTRANLDADREIVPLAVVTRQPSDDELIAELDALLLIVRGYAQRRQEYHHAAVSLDESVNWLRAAQKASSPLIFK